VKDAASPDENEGTAAKKDCYKKCCYAVASITG